MKELPDIIDLTILPSTFKKYGERYASPVSCPLAQTLYDQGYKNFCVSPSKVYFDNENRDRFTIGDETASLIHTACYLDDPSEVQVSLIKIKVAA